MIDESISCSDCGDIAARGLEYSKPDARLRPTIEPVVHGRVGPIAVKSKRAINASFGSLDSRRVTNDKGFEYRT